MKMKRLITLAVCIVMLLTTVVLPTALTVKAQTEQGTAYNYDYSGADSDNVSATASQVLEALGYELTDAEKAYLDAYCDFKLNYARVPNSEIEKIIEVVDGKTNVTILADPYTYTAVNGKTVTMIPTVASILDEERTLQYEAATVASSDYVGKYQAVFTDVTVNNKYAYEVNYMMDGGVEIDAQDLNVILNLAYNEVSATAQTVSFYLAGNQQIVERYREHLANYVLWTQAKQDYEEYLDALDQYALDKQSYDAYVIAHNAYLSAKNRDDEKLAPYYEKLALYNKYQADLATAKVQTDNLYTALMTRVTYLERQLYACFFSGLIDQVVANKDIITGAYQELGKHIDNSALASANLRKIFKPANGPAYDELETPEQYYDFYVANYAELKANILLLTNSLYLLYTTQGMKESMELAAKVKEIEDYTEKLVIFISQLIYLCEVLEDKPLTYLDGKGKTHTLSDIKFHYNKGSLGSDTKTEVRNVPIKTILENNIYVTDYNNATPFVVTKVDEPIYPTDLENPIEPVKVIEPTIPESVDAPGNEPVWYGTNVPGTLDFWATFLDDEDYREMLIGIHQAGLTYREEITSPVTYVPHASTRKPFDSDSQVTVNFVVNGSVHAVYVKNGGSVAANAPTPTKDEDLAASYVLDGWVDENGDPVSLHYIDIENEITLYPVFKPLYKNDPDLSDGVFDVNAGKKLKHLPLEYFIKQIKGNAIPKLKVLSDEATLVFKYSAIKALDDAGVSYVDVDITKALTFIGANQTAEPTRYTCKIQAYNDAGEKVDVNAVVTVYIDREDLDARIYYREDGKIYPISTNASSGNLYFSAKIGSEYVLDVEYGINNLDNGQDGRAPLIYNVPTSAAPGSTVTFTLDDYKQYSTYNGKRVDVFYMLGNEKIFIVGESFVMPEANIQIGVQITDILYTVKFIVDGREIYSKADYKYGDRIILPSEPQKLADGQYEYKFLGWFSGGIRLMDGDTVSDNMEYVAMFEAIPIQQEKQGINIFRVLFVALIVILSLGVVALVLFILNKTGVISISGIFSVIGGIFKKKDKNTPPTSTATRDQNISVKGGGTVNINVNTVGNEQVRINLGQKSLGGSAGKPTGNSSVGNNGANTGKSTWDRQDQSK